MSMKSELSCQTIEASVKLPLRVALVEDQPEIRKNWKRLIESFRDFEFVCACSSAEEALQTVPPARPDVVLMDIFLPGMSGIECTARLKALQPKMQIVILTAVDDEELVFLALEAGADGYLLKRTKPGDLRTALLDVFTGGTPMSSEIARRVVESFRRRAYARDDGTYLSTREEEVLGLLSKGYSNKEIAERLELGVDTVRSHLKHIYEKMHVRSRTEAVGRCVAGKPSTPEASGLQPA
jgi:DNA-binding NarL/FixJ family response regulator